MSDIIRFAGWTHNQNDRELNPLTSIVIIQNSRYVLEKSFRINLNLKN